MPHRRGGRLLTRAALRLFLYASRVHRGRAGAARFALPRLREARYTGRMLLPIPLGFLLGRSTHTSPKVFEPDYTRIRCPECGWQPVKSDAWVCSPGCGHAWNTFETAGVCPACGKQWLRTACHKCGVWSLHETWYEHEGT